MIDSGTRGDSGKEQDRRAVVQVPVTKQRGLACQRQEGLTVTGKQGDKVSMT
jgi:hypothetical protein